MIVCGVIEAGNTSTAYLFIFRFPRSTQRRRQRARVGVAAEKFTSQCTFAFVDTT